MRNVDCNMQGRHMRGVLSQLEGLWQQPSVAGFRCLGASDALTFTSHAWTLSLDPATGMSHVYCVVLLSQIINLSL